MTNGGASLSVLVIDEDAGILSFFAKLLDTNGIRALLARNSVEAMGIAKRGYVPIDLVLTDVELKSDGSGSELIDRLRQLRPEIRALYMSAYVESGVIRIEMRDRGSQPGSSDSDGRGLIESIRAAAARPLTRTAGSRNPR